MIIDDIRQAQLTDGSEGKVPMLLHVLHHFLKAHPEDRLTIPGASCSDAIDKAPTTCEDDLGSD
jgi:hypothetical protein